MLLLRSIAVATLLVASVVMAGQEKKPPQKVRNLTTASAASDPDFKIQGEYQGELTGKGKYAAQVVAKGNGKFEVYILAGGLPGAGWDKKTRMKLAAATKDGAVRLSDKWSGTIAEGLFSGKTDGDEAFQFKRVERKSPSLEARPPEGALVLFDGKDASGWSNGEVVDDNLLYRGTTSKKSYRIQKLHLEFRTPYEPKSGGQGRGNSGVYLHGKEIQVLDSFGLEGKNNECGGFYGHVAPAVNMCLPPLTWQTYDVEIQSDDKGGLKATVWHNGVKIHEDYPLAGKGSKGTNIHLQDHGNPVVYRNIWIVPTPDRDGDRK